jgi:hypothetical protein
LHDLAFEVAQFGQAMVHFGSLASPALPVTLQIVAYTAALRNAVSSPRPVASTAPKQAAKTVTR